ncbi:MAG: gas vesicle protein [Chloroflexota bacterium]
MTCPDSLPLEEHVSLCETLDRVLNKGVVVCGEIIISVADIDLIYLNLNAVLTSVETVNRLRTASAQVA